MNSLFASVKVLIWDFDGTLYKPNPALFHAVRESEYRTIMELTHWDKEKAIVEFEKYYKTITPSATQTVAKLCGISTAEAALTMEKYFDRREYLLRDDTLIDLFEKLKKFQHYILANGTQYRLKETLTLLDIPETTFVEIITSEQVGENKPSEKGFRYIMKKTGLEPSAHLMIGDRELVDIAPAKKLGMHTCLVWSETKSAIADVTLPTVYDVARTMI
jgi:HAD superfamily hydrolase (TIGR01549 family)